MSPQEAADRLQQGGEAVKGSRKEGASEEMGIIVRVTMASSLPIATLIYTCDPDTVINRAIFYS